jgi:hypothetical protein
VFGELTGLVSVIGCPGAVGCSKRHGGVSSTFDGRSCRATVRSKSVNLELTVQQEAAV